MEIVKVVIPSHKRHENILTTKAIDNAILCVPESQKALYELHNPNTEIVTHSDEIVGLLPKRNWIYRHFGSVLMLDDDISHLTRLYTEVGEENVVSPSLAYDIVQQTADACRQAGAFLFGFNTVPSPVMFKATAPIQLTGYVTGCAQGLLAGSKLYYNEAIKMNCDYWISLLNMFVHRYCFKDMRYYFNQKDTFVGKGGLAEFRNIETEKKDFEILKAYFGDAIDFKKTKNKKHPYQKTIKCPF